ncbi:hypothetical protein AWC11_14255 [Mycobacterium interjectum]|nr:hypothetical protein AWC11_14255 [Mycobacterium interjectum]
MTASLDSLENQGRIPIVSPASPRQSIEWLHVLQDLAIQLDAGERRQKVVELSKPQLPLSFIQFPLAVVNLALWSPYSHITHHPKLNQGVQRHQLCAITGF